jgi:hypothetical protein
MAILLSIPSQTYTPQTLNEGPFSVTALRGQQIEALFTATSWPATGIVGTVTITYDDGIAGTTTFLGATLPNSKGQFPTLGSFVPADANTVSIQIVISQSVTTPILIQTI